MSASTKLWSYSALNITVPRGAAAAHCPDQLHKSLLLSLSEPGTRRVPGYIVAGAAPLFEGSCVHPLTEVLLGSGLDQLLDQRCRNSCSLNKGVAPSSRRQLPAHKTTLFCTQKPLQKYGVSDEGNFSADFSLNCVLMFQANNRGASFVRVRLVCGCVRYFVY